MFQKHHIKNKKMTIAFWIMRLIVIAELVSALFLKNYLVAMQAVWILFLFMLPTLIERHMHIEFPTIMEVTLVCFVFAALFLGEIGEFYYRFPWWDIMLHTISGFIIGVIGFSLIRLLNESEKVKISLSPLFVAIFTFTFALGVGGLWEIFEFAADRIVGTNMQKYMMDEQNIKLLSDTIMQANGNMQILTPIFKKICAFGLSDTMWDIIVDAVGAGVFSILGYLYLIGKSKIDISKLLLKRREDRSNRN